MSLILVTGGARAGKSTFAERLAQRVGGNNVCFVATAEPSDDEMRDRIAAHRAQRPAAWVILETPRDVARSLSAARPEPMRVVLIDCLTLLVSNLIPHNDSVDAATAWPIVEREILELRQFAESSRGLVIAVTNEVGLGIVPLTKVGRVYQDLLGKANQIMAAAAGEVFLIVAGIAVPIKSIARRVRVEDT